MTDECPDLDIADLDTGSVFVPLPIRMISAVVYKPEEMPMYRIVVRDRKEVWKEVEIPVPQAFAEKAIAALEERRYRREETE